MFKNKGFWLALSALSIVFVFVAYSLFPKAFSILNIDLKMSRNEAHIESERLSKEFNLGPESNFQVSTFGSDGMIQNFIELKQGGAKKFNEILQDTLNDYYIPYTWKIRHYEPNNINEVWFSFTPSGEIYSFHEIISEDLYIKSVNADEALNIAESNASEYWNVDFSNYKLIEKSEDLKPSNRLDHTFTYNRTDVDLGEEGEYRLELIVSGDKLTKVDKSVKVPEVFYREYEEMRSFNNTIAQFASYALFLIYILGGVVFGLFIMNRAGWVIWKMGIYWAIFIASLMTLSTLNFFPLSWLNYNTAISVNNFMMQGVVSVVMGFILMFVYLSLSFVAAETLSRKAFPEHLKFWNLWSKNNAGTSEVVGQTLGGYFLVALDLFYVITFYMITTTYFGWWTPSGPLFSPDMIATPFPWLSAIGMSLHAGFWEECLFRAVPIAGAALIGQKYGKKGLFIAIAMILQAVIFAAAHANYPSVPSYSRLIELLIPSLFWGFVYLRFGLLPVIISHFVYDVVWFSLPIFVSTSSDLIFDKIMVILLALIPFWVILRSLVLNKFNFTAISKEAYNSSFSPIVKNIDLSQDEMGEKINIEKSKYHKFILYGFFILGAVFIFVFPSKKPSILPLEVSRTEALDLADQYMSESGIELDESWTQMSSFSKASIDSDDFYIWEKKGREGYEKLLGTYINFSSWRIRYAKFSGDINEKAEEYYVYLNHDGTLNQIGHKLPENKTGATLSKDQARDLAIDYIKKTYKLDSIDLDEISAESMKLVNRKDWMFIFNDISSYEFGEIDLRIKVNISGDEVALSNRYIHVPEEWSRLFKDDLTSKEILSTICYVLIAFFVLYAIANSISNWNKGGFDFPIFKLALICFFSLSFFNIFNSYPSIINSFSTAKPYMSQLLRDIIGSVIGSLITSSVLALIIGNLKNIKFQKFYKYSNFQIILLTVGAIGLIKFSMNVDQIAPIWINISNTNHFLPSLSYLSESVFSYFSLVVVLLSLIQFINKLTEYAQSRHYLYIMIIFLSSFAFLGSSFASSSVLSSIPELFIVSLQLACIVLFLYKFFIIYDITIIPIAVSLIIASNLLITAAIGGAPGLLFGNSLSAVVIIVIGYYTRIALNRE